MKYRNAVKYITYVSDVSHSLSNFIYSSSKCEYLRNYGKTAVNFFGNKISK